MMNNASLASLIVLLLCIGITIFLYTEKNKKYYKLRQVPLIIGGVFLIAIVFVPFILSSIEQSKVEYFQGVTIKQDNIEELELITVHNKFELRSVETQEIITYIELDNKKELRFYEPVYLSSFDEYHLVIYSASKTNYESGYFRQADYPLTKNPDVMVLIHKTTRRLIPIQDGELIGMTFQLSKITLSGNTLLIPIPRKHQINSIFFIGFTINPSYLTTGYPYPYYERFMGFEHYNTTSNFIQHYALSKDQILLWVNDLGDVFLEQHMVLFEVSSSSSNINKRPDTFLNSITNVKNGEFVTHFGDIYYLDDLLTIKKIVTLDVHETIVTLTSKDNWQSHIPTS